MVEIRRNAADGADGRPASSDADLSSPTSEHAVHSGDAQKFGIASRAYEVDELPAVERLKLARQLLLFLGVLTVGVFVAYPMDPENAALQAIFELFKIGVLPLITLIVSFYFSRTDH